MGFVGHHQVLVGIQNGFGKGHHDFARHFAKIVDAQADLVSVFGPNWLLLGIQHATTGHAVKPDLATDRRKVRA